MAPSRAILRRASSKRSRDDDGAPQRSLREVMAGTTHAQISRVSILALNLHVRKCLLIVVNTETVWGRGLEGVPGF